MTDIVTAQGRLYLVDAHAYLHRAYHVLRLSTSSGRPVGALYGFATMLLGLVKKESPDFVAVCFDAPGPTFRHRAFAAYKANRKELDEDLKDQLARAKPLAEAMGFSCVQVPGFEADDLMATLASRAAGEAEVVLVTPDKDACQLVGPGVRVLRELGEPAFDAERVHGKFGVKPEQMADYLALIGDASDNVPGVPGIGPVGAAKILGRYGNLDRAIEAARSSGSELPPKTARALREARDQAILSRELIRLNHEAPLATRLGDCRVAPVDCEKLLPLLKELEFHSLIRDLFPAGAEKPVSGRRVHPAAGQADDQAGPSAGDRGSRGAGLQPPAVMKLDDWLKAASKSKRISAAHCSLPPAELLGGSDWALAVGLPDERVAWIEPEDAKRLRASLAHLFLPERELVGHDLSRSQQ